jgi:hypothetical protein
VTGKKTSKGESDDSLEDLLDGLDTGVGLSDKAVGLLGLVLLVPVDCAG